MHSGDVVWTGQHFVLSWRFFAGLDAKFDVRWIAGLEAYDEQGRLQWAHAPDRPYHTIWMQDGALHGLVVDGHRFAVHRIALDGTSRVVNEYLVADGRSFETHARAYPGARGLWVFSNQGAVALLADGDVVLEMKDINHHPTNAVVDEAGNLHLFVYVLDRKTLRSVRRRVIIHPDGARTILPHADSVALTDAVRVDDGFMTVGTRLSERQTQLNFEPRARLGGQLQRVGPDWTPTSTVDVDRVGDCEFEKADGFGGLHETPSGWLVTGSICDRLDAADIWLVEADRAGRERRQRRINLNVDDRVQGLAISDSGVIALSGTQRECCADIIGNTQPYMMFIDPDWACLDAPSAL